MHPVLESACSLQLEAREQRPLQSQVHAKARLVYGRVRGNIAYFARKKLPFHKSDISVKAV